MTPEPSPRRLRADAARNRQALIDAAQSLLLARGLSVTLDDIAAEAGVNVATAYRHFANKHELIAAFLEQQVMAATTIAEEAAGADDPWQGLTGYLSRMLGLITASRGLHDVLAPTYAGNWIEVLDERLTPAVRRLMSRAQDAGALRPDIELGDLGVVLRMLAALSDIPYERPEALTDRYLALILDGLRPAAALLPGHALASSAFAPRRGTCPETPSKLP
jgi:AcrR family transcriptional regulator